MNKRDIIASVAAGIILATIFTWIVASVVHYPFAGYLAEWSFWNIF